VSADRPESASTWIIGYGNVYRRDDGIGPYVVQQLSHQLESTGKITFGSFHQLDPALAEELQEAEVLILVDATVEPLERGLRWTRVQPEQALYGRAPTTWLVSVQGEDFGHGEGLSLEAQEKAERASSEIVEFCLREIIDKGHGSINDRQGGSR
jgi:Ni,Fe-hydrogenase maturation factor